MQSKEHVTIPIVDEIALPKAMKLYLAAISLLLPASTYRSVKNI